MKLRFKPILEKNIIIKLEDICSKENFTIDTSILKKINDISKGDVRKSIMILQNLKYIYDYQKSSISIEDVYNITGYVSKKLINKIYKKTISKDTQIEDIIKSIEYIKLKGYPINSILYTLNEIILNDKQINDSIKSKIFYNLGLIEKKLNDGSDEFIQLLSLFTYISNLIKYPDNEIVLDIVA